MSSAQLRRRLGAVDEEERAGVVGEAGDLGDRVIGAEHVGDVRDGDQLRAALEQLPRVRPGRAGPRASTGAQSISAPDRSASCCQGTMFEWCSISVSTIRSPAPTLASPQARATRLIASVALRTKIDLAPVGGADVVGDRRAGALVGGGRLGRERVDAAVDVRVVAALVAVDRLDRGEHPLGAGAAVEVGELVAVDLALERRERGADLLDGVPRPRLGLSRVGSIAIEAAGAPPRPPRGSSRSPSPRAARPAPGRPP